MKKILVLSLITILLCACTKETVDDRPEYIGWWVAEEGITSYLITINSDGTGSYKKSQYNSGISFTGALTANGKVRIKRNGKRLKIGTKGFDIDQAPRTDYLGDKTLVLDGIEYYSYY